MSGSQGVNPDARLVAVRRTRTDVGAAVHFELRDITTGALIDGATGVTARYWLPGDPFDDASSHPATPVVMGPGAWLVPMPVLEPGTVTVQLAVLTPIRQTAQDSFDPLALTPQPAGNRDLNESRAAGAIAGAQAASGAIATRVPIVGGVAMTGPLEMVAPIKPAEGARKAEVDAAKRFSDRLSIYDKMGETISPEQFYPAELEGKTPYVAAPYDGAAADAAFDATAAIEAAFAKSAETGWPVSMTRKAYRQSRPIRVPSGLKLVGGGPGNAPIGGGEGATGSVDMENATILLLHGDFPREFYATGVTDCRTAVGFYPNPDAIEPGYDSNYRLTSFYNEDADTTTGRAATRRAFSAGLVLEPNTTGVEIEGIRVMQSFDGVKGYNDQRLEFPSNVDVGIFIDNAHHNIFRRVNAFGHYADAGWFQLVGACRDRPGQGYGCEANVFDDCSGSGMSSFLTRSMDLHRVMGVGPDWIEVPWAANHPFDHMINYAVRKSTPPETYFTFTGVEKRGDVLRLTGITDNSPAGTGLVVGNAVTPGHTSVGLGEMTAFRLKLGGMGHRAGKRATSAALSTFRKNRPSFALEISGWRLRGMRFPLLKIMTQEDGGILAPYANDLTLLPSVELESKRADGLGLSMRIITAPQSELNTIAPHPVGQTYGFWVDMKSAGAGVDFRPHSTTNPPRFPTPTNYCQFNAGRIYHLQTERITNGAYLYSTPSASAGIRSSNGANVFSYNETDNQAYLGRDAVLGTDRVLSSQGNLKMSTTGGNNVLVGNPVIFQAPDATPQYMRLSPTDVRALLDLRLESNRLLNSDSTLKLGVTGGGFYPFGNLFQIATSSGGTQLLRVTETEILPGNVAGRNLASTVGSNLYRFLAGWFEATRTQAVIASGSVAPLTITAGSGQTVDFNSPFRPMVVLAATVPPAGTVPDGSRYRVQDRNNRTVIVNTAGRFFEDGSAFA